MSGFSRCLYDASWTNFKSTVGAGTRFKDLLINHYPWNNGDYDKHAGSKFLYGVARNPLAHSLGLQSNSRITPLEIKKDHLGAEKILQLEAENPRPSWLPPTLMTVSAPLGNGISLYVGTLYWGTWRTLESVWDDDSQMVKAEPVFETLGFG